MNFNLVSREDRIMWLKSMDEFICNDGDESIWFAWISVGVPDGAQEDDYEYIADNKDLWDDCWDFFERHYFYHA